MLHKIPIDQGNHIAWNKLLPCLIDHLEVNRKNRLWLARLDKLHEWLEALRGQTFRTKLATATSRHRTITGTFGNNYRVCVVLQICNVCPVDEGNVPHSGTSVYKYPLSFRVETFSGFGPRATHYSIETFHRRPSS